MWTKINDLNELKDGDKVKCLCVDGVTREGVIMADECFFGSEFAMPFDYNGLTFGNINVNLYDLDYFNDAFIGDCEVWKI